MAMMIKTFMLRLFLFFFFFIPVFAVAQPAQNDFRIRTGIKLNFDLPKGFTFSAQYQYRAKNNATVFSGSYFTGNLEYAIFKKYLSAEIEYTFKTSTRRNLHYLGAGLTGKHQHKKFTIYLRSIYQRRQEYFASDYEPEHEPYDFWRNRLQLKYKCSKKIDASLYAESFLLNTGAGLDLNRMRYMASVDWEPKKRHTLSLFYFIQPVYNTAPHQLIYSAGFMYKYDVPRFWKKKKTDETK